jgi:hypothetical protein
MLSGLVVMHCFFQGIFLLTLIILCFSQDIRHKYDISVIRKLEAGFAKIITIAITEELPGSVKISRSTAEPSLH